MAVTSPRVTASYPFDSQPASFENSMLQYCFFSILTTSWCIAATGRKKWRNGVLVDQNGKYGYLSN